jgi:hypothetical protein
VDFDESVDLTPEQRKAFVEDGFIIIRNAVPVSLVNAALAEINRTLLKPGDEEIHNGYMSDSDTLLHLLYGTPLWTMAQRLMGRRRIRQNMGCQVALRAGSLNWPSYANNDEIPPRGWHIDGMYNPEKKWAPFSLLCGICLSDQLLPNCGNLISFKGSHHLMQPMVNEEWRNPGTHPFLKQRDAPTPPLKNGMQVLLGVGDAVLQHHKVAHRVGVNCTPHIRYQAYFRLIHVDREAHCADESVLSLWRQFEGLETEASMATKPP